MEITAHIVWGKTWGYHARMQGVDLALIMHNLNHESIAYTKRYLGITDDELEAVAQRLNLWAAVEQSKNYQAILLITNKAFFLIK